MVTPKTPLGLHVRILDLGLARMISSADSSLSSDVAVGTPIRDRYTDRRCVRDYARGGGWPLTGVPASGSKLLVDWIRVYSLPPGT